MTTIRHNSTIRNLDRCQESAASAILCWQAGLSRVVLDAGEPPHDALTSARVTLAWARLRAAKAKLAEADAAVRLWVLEARAT